MPSLRDEEARLPHSSYLLVKGAGYAAATSGKTISERHTREGLIIGDIGPLLMAPLLDVEQFHRFIILAVCNVTTSVL